MVAQCSLIWQFRGKNRLKKSTFGIIFFTRFKFFKYNMGKKMYLKSCWFEVLFTQKIPLLYFFATLYNWGYLVRKTTSEKPCFFHGGLHIEFYSGFWRKHPIIQVSSVKYENELFYLSTRKKTDGWSHATLASFFSAFLESAGGQVKLEIAGFFCRIFYAVEPQTCSGFDPSQNMIIR